MGRLTVVLGPAATIVYVAFAFLSYLEYPTAYGPFENNWLSDLGNRNLNPAGAGFYVIGCIATGVLVIGFFAGLAEWWQGSPKRQRWLLALLQVAGVMGGLAVIMSAVYTEDQFEAHQLWSRVISGSLAVALFISPFALHRTGIRLWPLIAVSALGYASIVARLLFVDAHWLEWPSLGLLLVYLCVVAVMTDALSSRPRLRLPGPTLFRPAKV